MTGRKTTDEGKVTYRALLGNGSFRKLWIGQFVSGVGDWLVVGLLIPLVTTLSGGSAFAVAGIMIVKILPALLLTSVIGVFVDRFDRRRLMIACDLVRAVLTLGLLFTNSLALIYLIVFLMEAASLFFAPAKNSLIPHLVDENELAAANGLSYTTQQASMLIGLTMSGAILAGFEAIVRWLLTSGFVVVDKLVGPLAPALLGPRGGVFVNAFSFIVSAITLASIHVSAKVSSGGRFTLSLLGKDTVESFRFLAEHKELRGLLVTVGTAILGGGAIITVGLVHVQRNLSGGVPFLDRVEVLRKLIAAPQTFMLVFIALGMAAGALIVPRLSERVPLQALFLGAVATFGIGMLVFAFSSQYWVGAVFALIAGFTVACLTVSGNTYVVRTVADEIRGRVFTAMESVIRVSLLLSMVVVSPAADLIGKGALAIAKARGIAPQDVWFSGTRVTLVLASLIVLGAAWYAYRTLNWRGGDTDGAPSPAGGAPDA
ncbi:MAG: MFS transporter [Actinomycetia bacterium]|nr:MFS transporter [Actinomycetes bacterium]